MNRSCRRQTQVAGLPVADMIALVPVPSADKSTIRARQTYFCGEDGAELIAARRRRSLGDTITQFLCASPSIAHLETQRNPNSDSFVPVNPIAKGTMTAERFASCGHVMVVRRGLHSREIDEAVLVTGLERRIAIVVNGFAAALALARETQLVPTVPERHTEVLRRGMYCFALPIEIPAFTISMLWHPPMDGNLAHRWLRGCVRSLCTARRGEIAGD
jgi:DNA-binding transcriptional LysR family regulator